MTIHTLLLLAALLLPTSSWAAIAFVSQTDSTDTLNVSQITMPVTVPAGTDRDMAVCVQVRRSGTATTAFPVTDMTFNGTQALTFVRADDKAISGANPNRTELWNLVAPTVTTGNLVINWSGANQSAIGATAVLLTGVNQSTPIDSHAGSSGETSTPTATITTIADNAAILDCAMGRADTGLTVGAGQTVRTNRILQPAGVAEGAGVSSVIPKTPAGSEAMNWTQTGAFGWATSVMSLVPSGGSDPAPVVPGQVTLTWANCIDPGSPASGIVNTTIRRCTGSSCAVATAGPGIGSVSFPQTTYIDSTPAVGTSYTYAAFCTDGVGLTGPNSGTASITTSGTPPATPPTITAAVADATGANLTYGPVTPTQIEVNIFSNTRGAISSVIHAISDFPAGRYTHAGGWLNGYDGVCFVPIDAAGVRNTTLTGYGCDGLTDIVGPLDTTPPTLSSCQPTTDRPAGTTQWGFSCDLNKPGFVKYDTVDTSYDLMANTMAINALTASATKTGLTNGSTTPLYLRSAVQDIFDDIHPATSSTVVTLTVASSTSDTTPPGNVANLIGTVLGNAISLSWDATTDAVSYQVYQSSDNVNFAPAGNPVGTTSLQLSLVFNSTYYLKIKALDSSGNLSAAFSNTVTKTTTLASSNTPLSDLEGLRLEVFTRSIRASWITEASTAGPVSTNLEYCLAEVGQTDCVNFNVTVSNLGQNFLTLNLLPGRLYCFRGKHTDGSGNMSLNYSPTVCAETTITGISLPRSVIPFGVAQLPLVSPRLPNATTRIAVP